MPQKGQVTVTLKKELIEKIKQFLPKEKPKIASVAGFVTEAIEEKLDRLKAEGGKADGS